MIIYSNVLHRDNKGVTMKKNNGLIAAVVCFIATTLVALILLSCSMLYTTGEFKKTFQQFVVDVLSEVCLGVNSSNSSVISYIKDENERVSNNKIVEEYHHIFPIHEYFSGTGDIQFQMYAENTLSQVKVASSSYTLNDSSRFLFYNGNIYNNNKEESQNLEAENDSNESSELSENSEDSDKKTEVIIIQGEIYQEGEVESDHDEKSVPALGNQTNGKTYTRDQLREYDFFISNLYIVDRTTEVSKALFNADSFLNKDMTMEIKEGKPQILIYHTHSQETYYDSRKGVAEDTIVGVGDYLTDLLENTYGIGVIHDKTTYDIIDGKLDRSLAYSVATPSIEKILEYNPTIEVIIDLHRDGLKEGLERDEGKRTTTIDGKEVAQIMFFNGLSKNHNGDISWLPNENLEGNLAFSLQLNLLGRKYFPNFMYRIYLKAYRYNLHLMPKSLLVELGTQYNTVEEAKNAMDYFALILNEALTNPTALKE